MLTCYCDGGAKPNPGKMYGSYMIFDGDKMIVHSQYNFGFGTNNQAEYYALIKLLETLSRLKDGPFKVYMDSELVIKQLSGEYSARSKLLSPLYKEASKLLDECDYVNLTHIDNRKMKQILGH